VGAQAKKIKNMKLRAYDEVETVLLQQFQQMHSDNVPINRHVLQEKANETELCLI
jgi:hypothetical protein